MFWRKRREHDLERELRAHLDLEAEEQRDPYAARRAFGNLALIQEDTRAMWRFAWLDRLAHEVRYALRSLRRKPAFTVAAVASLAWRP